MTPDDSIDFEKSKSIKKEKIQKKRYPVKTDMKRRTSRWRTVPSTAQVNIINAEMKTQFNNINNEV